VDPAKASEAADRVATVPSKALPVALSERYLRAVSRLEARPGNRPRADKSWVESTLREFRDLIARAKRVR